MAFASSPACRGPRLDPVVEFRLRCVEEAKRAGVPAAVRTFGRSRATVYRWLAC
ncbi:MAG: hypothetical protein M3464_17805 [Chloroflexota bacterium]|nr:hypothetical protein [Chloroflexota bacterium]